MPNKNIVFIAKSLDGYISDKNNNLDWLNDIPNPNQIDMGFNKLIDEIDAIILGKTTFQTILGFNIPWPYLKPVFVLSNTLTEVPSELKQKVTILKGNLTDILKVIHNQGFLKLYIDGGNTIQNFLKEDLIDELIITTIPILLGGGTPLFGKLDNPLKFDLIESNVFLNQIVQSKYKRKI